MPSAPMMDVRGGHGMRRLRMKAAEDRDRKLRGEAAG